MIIIEEIEEEEDRQHEHRLFVRVFAHVGFLVCNGREGAESNGRGASPRSKGCGGTFLVGFHF